MTDLSLRQEERARPAPHRSVALWLAVLTACVTLVLSEGAITGSEQGPYRHQGLDIPLSIVGYGCATSEVLRTFEPRLRPGIRVREDLPSWTREVLPRSIADMHCSCSLHYVSALG